MKVFLRLIFISLSSLCLSGFLSLEPPDANVLLKGVKQDFLSYASPKTLDQPLVTPSVQQNYYQNYLKYYFSPWNQVELLYPKKSVEVAEQAILAKSNAQPGWGENAQVHSQQWMSEIKQNMAMNSYPNHAQEAITTQITHLRELPTTDPSFKAWNKSFDGYPFDLLSTSLLPANLPIKVMQISQDHAWALVLTPFKFLGWLPVDSFAWVDKSFMQRWQKTGRYIAITQDKLPIWNEDQSFLFFGRIGAIYPLVAQDANGYHVLVAAKDLHRKAVMHEVVIAKKAAEIMPIPLTARNLGNLANRILGQPYDWGGHYGYRDCSSTLMDLFTPFGIWLPRNSAAQAHTGEFTSLESLNSVAKRAFIEQHATPFLTLLWIPGHVVLYLGKQGTQSYVYQTMWGLKLRSWFQTDDRLVVGKTVIVPIDFAEEFYFKPPRFLARIEGMTLLVKG